MNNCPKCGWDLSVEVGTQRDSYHTAIQRALKRLRKDTGFGIKDEKHNKTH
jgi:hypothetical protein